ncbi:MAG TPA: response regulator, partial [Candidatus Dormibacteraeota bacterium]|nr:response regulator [Candidatus Dormibacteraeota bacterium]
MRTVLLIEDDLDVRSVLATLLRRQGWQVFEAAAGEAGLELARKHRPQAILCDLFMPGTNGFHVFSTLRADRALGHSFLLAMSGRSFEDTRQSALEAGADEFLAKPIDPDRLLALLDRLVAPESPVYRGGLTPESSADAPRIRFWGVRGSVPVPGPDTVRYGGNTACVEVRAAGQIVILDAG